MNGVNLAEAGHSVNLLAPVSISGGKTSQAFHLKNAEHVTIYIQFGVRGASNPTSIIVNQCTDASGSNATAIPFRFYYQATGGAGNDTLVGPFYAAATGITSTLPTTAPFPTSVQNLLYVIEIDAAELEGIAGVVGPITEYPYINVVIADGGNTTFANILAVQTGLRFAYKGSPTVTT